MAAELEETIMQEIGLGSHYNWYNGSSTCGFIRMEAAHKIENVILKHNSAGEKIAKPNKELINLLKKVAKIGDKSESCLTNTWKAASEIIAVHIYSAYNPLESGEKAFKSIGEYVKNNYLPQQEGKDYLDESGMNIVWGRD